MFIDGTGSSSGNEASLTETALTRIAFPRRPMELRGRGLLPSHIQINDDARDDSARAKPAARFLPLDRGSQAR
jgi:hypothetical protein